MLQSLNEFSKNIAGQLFQEYPEWIELASVEEENGSRYLLVQIHPPSGSSEFPLSIDTSNNEVTVAYDHYHAHYSDYLSDDGNDASSFIKTLLADDSAVVSYWRDNAWCGSYILSVSCLPLDNAEQPYANRVKIRSWSGLLNKDIECIARG